MVERVYKFALYGLKDAEMAFALGVAIQTFDMWKIKYPEFKAAVLRGRMNADCEVASALYHKACGYSHPDTIVQIYKGKTIKIPVTKHYPPDTGAAIFWLKNRSKNLETPWTDSSRTEISGVGGKPIDIRKLKIDDLAEQLTMEELQLMASISKKAHVKGTAE